MAGLTIAFNDSIMQHESTRRSITNGRGRGEGSVRIPNSGRIPPQQHVSAFRKSKRKFDDTVVTRQAQLGYTFSRITYITQRNRGCY